MTHFARKLCYAANDGENGATFAALIELADKKGGPSTGFVLFWRILRSPPMRCESKMIRLKVETAEEAQKFWLGGKKFPGWQSERWQKTTPWLDRVAAGGWYEQYPPLTWVKVGTPNLWARRRKKRVPQFGDMGFALREHKMQLRELEEQKWNLENSFPDSFDEETGDYYLQEDEEAAARIRRCVDEIDEVILAAKNDIEAIEAEMRFKVRQKFPHPIGKTPRRVLRQQTEAVLRASRW